MTRHLWPSRIRKRERGEEEGAARPPTSGPRTKSLRKATMTDEVSGPSHVPPTLSFVTKKKRNAAALAI